VEIFPTLQTHVPAFSGGFCPHLYTNPFLNSQFAHLLHGGSVSVSSSRWRSSPHFRHTYLPFPGLCPHLYTNPSLNSQFAHLLHGGSVSVSSSRWRSSPHFRHTYLPFPDCIKIFGSKQYLRMESVQPMLIWQDNNYDQVDYPYYSQSDTTYM